MVRAGFVLLLLVAPLLANLAIAGAPQEDLSFVVSFVEVPEDLREGDAFGGGRVVRVDRALGFAVVESPGARAMDAAARDPNVRAIEPDARLALAQASTDDPLLPLQDGLEQVRAPEAWDLESGAASTVLCVVDTGIRHTHEDLAGARWLGGHDFENDDADPWDDHGHGTHVAGIVAATAGNGRGIAGVAQVGVMAVKALDANGAGRLSNVASGIRWCAERDADVVSLSLGIPFPLTVLEDAIQYAVARDVVVVAAAGNSGPCDDCVAYPAAYPEVVAVGCVDGDAETCGFSSRGPEVDLAAPGAAILSTWNADDAAYERVSGTSMSAPHVAGIAALLRSKAPELTQDQVRALLTSTARDLGAPGPDEASGHGLVDARAALERLVEGSVPEPQPEPQPQPRPENAAPVARAGEDATAFDPDGDGVALVRLDGSASTDVDGTLASYAWTHHGDVVAQTSTALVPLRVGRHDLELTVTDELGATATDEVRVTVERNGDPTAVFSSHCDGLSCTFDARGSFDPDGPVASYRWDFGDDTVAEGALVTHTFAEADEHRVELTVWDEGGERDRIREELFVVDAPRVHLEGFEDGDAGWSFTASEPDEPNLWRVADDCAASERGGPALQFGRDAPACDVGAVRARGSATSPVIDLSGAEVAALRFVHQREGNEEGDSRASMRVEVSDDGGRSWRRAEEWRADDVAPSGWHEVTLDVSRSASPEFRVRFTFDARGDDGAAAWSVDDVELLAR